MNQIEQTPNGKDYFEPMHSAEHLINGAIARTLGCGRAFSTHIEKKKSKCDFRFHRNLTPEELTGIERTVNEQIASHADVRDEILTAAEAAATTVRIVHIGDFDSCPCIGAHVSNTAEIPPVRLISSDCADGVLRVRFKFVK